MKQATGPFRMESAKRPDFGQDIDLPPGAKGSGPEGMVREMKARRNVLRNVLPGLYFGTQARSLLHGNWSEGTFSNLCNYFPVPGRSGLYRFQIKARPMQ